MNFIKKIIDNWYFQRMIKEDKVGLTKDDLQWLRDNKIKITRITETMKFFIVTKTVHGLTPIDQARKKYWIDCLTTLQMWTNNNRQDKMDYVTMKPKA